MSQPPLSRVVFDTNTVLSTLLFRNGRLAWLRSHWMQSRCLPLLSRETAAELARVFGYQKFGLTASRRAELLGFYLPYCEIVEVRERFSVICRDAKDQMFLDLAHSGRADILVSGDRDLLALAGQASFAIESPEDYRLRILGRDPTR